MRQHIRKLSLYFRVTLTFGLLYLVFRNLNIDDFQKASQEFDLFWFILAVASTLSALSLAALRWRLLMLGAGLNLDIPDCVALYFAGAFINQGIPSTLGGDGFRSVTAAKMLHGYQSNYVDADLDKGDLVDTSEYTRILKVSFIIVFIDRFIGFIGNNLFGALGLMVSGAVLADWLLIFGFLSLILTVVLSIICVIFLHSDKVTSLLQKFLRSSVSVQQILRLRLTFRGRAWLVHLFLTCAVQTLVILSLLFCFRSYGIMVPFEALMIGLPALGLLLLLPISISGWGIRETALASILGSWHIAPANTVVASVTFGVVLFLASSPGAYFFLKGFSFSRRDRPVEPKA